MHLRVLFDPPKTGLTKALLIMKFTATILLAACLQVSATGNSQTVTLSENNTSLERIFREVKRQTGYDFWYESKLLKQAKKVNIHVKTVPLEEVLDLCFQGQLLSYSIVEKTIIVKPRATPQVEIDTPPPPLTDITGKVTDAEGKPLAGASVKLKGTNIGTPTDASGNFTLQVPDGGGVLVISYVGFQTIEVRVSKATRSLNIALKQGLAQVDEIVVVGYGTQRRKDLTGSVSSISEAQIVSVPVTTLDQAIQGRAAGVNVTNNDGAPGAPVFVQIRGIGSLGNNTPLYVVDGYPITGGLNALNPNDIASIDILKDASATAIYGNRASNGVVIITTKRGTKNGVQLSLDPVISVQSQPKMYKVLNAQQYATLANELAPIVAEGVSPLPEWSNPSALRNIDWQDAVYRPGLKQNYNIALRGGNDKVRSAFSAGYFDQKGIVLGSDFKRINASLNLDYNAFAWLKSSSSIKYTRGKSKTSIQTGGQVGDSEEKGILDLSFLPPTLAGGNKLTDQVKDGKGNYGFYPPNKGQISDYGNPVYDAETNDVKNENDVFLGTTSLEVTVLDGLKLKTNFGISTNEASGYLFKPSDTRALEQYGDNGIARAQNTYSQYANKSFEWLWENTISYTKTFGDHSIDFVGGVSTQENTFRQMGVKGFGSISDVLRDVGSIVNITDLSGNERTYSFASQFGRINYKFMDKYLITGTVRRDGSSKFAKNHQYGVFPSGSIAWKVKEESFLKSVRAVDDLKIRASYGEVGSQDGVGPFQYLAQYSTGGPQIDPLNFGYPFNGSYQPGLRLAAIPNPDLKWETSKMTDIGFDITFLNGALTLTADYYRKESKDFLLNIPVPTQTGFTTAARNVGSIRNSGIEIALDYRKSKKDFSYGINVNLSTVKNKLLSLTQGITTLSDLQLSGDGTGIGFQGGSWPQFSRTRIGGPVGEFYGYKSAGIFQTQAEIDALDAQAEVQNGAGAKYQFDAVPGDRKFVDVNGDGLVNADDRISLGSPIPKIFGGLNLDATYKSFDLNVFFYGVSGNKIFNYQKASLESFDGLTNISEEYYLNRWTPGKSNNNRYTRVTNADNNDNTRPSDVYCENGSYLRLRNVQIGYTLPSNLSRMLSIEKLRLFFSAQNLFTITKYTGLDPEIGLPQEYDAARRYGPAGVGDLARSVGASGVDVGTYPLSKIYTFGLNVTF